MCFYIVALIQYDPAAICGVLHQWWDLGLLIYQNESNFYAKDALNEKNSVLLGIKMRLFHVKQFKKLLFAQNRSVVPLQ